MGTPDTFEIISFIAASSVCFNCHAVVYNNSIDNSQWLAWIRLCIAILFDFAATVVLIRLKAP